MDDQRNNTPKGMRLAFGIFMVIIYVGIGLLFILGVLPFFNNYALACVLGGLLCAYGVFRAVRLYQTGR